MEKNGASVQKKDGGRQSKEKSNGLGKLYSLAFGKRKKSGETGCIRWVRGGKGGVGKKKPGWKPTAWKRPQRNKRTRVEYSYIQI